MVFCLLSQRQLEVLASVIHSALIAINVEMTVDSVLAAFASTDAWLLPAHSNAWRFLTLLKVINAELLVMTTFIVPKIIIATCVLMALASTDAF